MAIAPDEFQLEAIAQAHPIAAALFVPFVRARLVRDDTTTETTLTVLLRDIDGPGEQQRKLRLWWLPATAPAQPLGGLRRNANPCRDGAGRPLRLLALARGR